MADYYDIIEAARKYGYAVRIPLCQDAGVTFVPAHGEREQEAFSYPERGIDLIADKVIDDLKRKSRK